MLALNMIWSHIAGWFGENKAERRKQFLLFHGEWDIPFNERCTGIWHLQLMEDHDLIDFVRNKGKKNWAHFKTFVSLKSYLKQRSDNWTLIPLITYFSIISKELFKDSQRGWACSSVEECLPNMCKVLVSNPWNCKQSIKQMIKEKNINVCTFYLKCNGLNVSCFPSITHEILFLDSSMKYFPYTSSWLLSTGFCLSSDSWHTRLINRTWTAII